MYTIKYFLNYLWHKIGVPTSNTSSCPDLIQSSGIIPPSLSNHNPVFACLKTEKPKAFTYKRQIWCTENVDWNALNTELSQHNWEPVLMKDGIENMVKSWCDTYTSICNHHINRKTVTIRPSEPKWMTPQLRTSIRQRNRLHNLAKRLNLPSLWTDFRNSRNGVITQIRQAIRKHT
jgi:hypothetical protein